MAQCIERWGLFEVTCGGRADGNPFTDHTITGTFTSKNETVKVDGFYDGDGCYKVRFMPSFTGDYEYCIEGDFSGEKTCGQFTALPPCSGNHGPVRVANTFHLAYADGLPHYSIGTTCYVWELQNEELQKQTLETLKKNAFNKIRFCIFPKHYDYNLKEPRSYPYIGTPMDSSVLTSDNFGEYSGSPPGNQWDFTRFNIGHFQNIDNCIAALCEMNIEADIILMHPYDRWGFSHMAKEQDDLYFNYVVARYAAYRNVWWSLANEYDLMPQKTLEDWERLASIIYEKDPYNHLRSIHNCRPFYDFTRPWITHCSIQRQDAYKTAELVNEWRERYQKPVILDEICYEGNVQHGWGNISGAELVRRFWEATCRGGYAGHSETYMNPKDVIWWSHGGTLSGESPERLRFLSKILQEVPGHGLMPYPEGGWDEVAATLDRMKSLNDDDPDFLLIYYGFDRPSFREYSFGRESHYRVEVIDTWEMTIEDRGVHNGKLHIKLPGKEYMAVRLTKQ